MKLINDNALNYVFVELTKLKNRSTINKDCRKIIDRIIGVLGFEAETSDKKVDGFLKSLEINKEVEEEKIETVNIDKPENNINLVDDINKEMGI